MKAVLSGAEDMSMGNFVAECAVRRKQKKVRYLEIARPHYGYQGPTLAHPEWNIRNARSAPLKEPHMFQRYYHLRNLQLRTELLVKLQPKQQQTSHEQQQGQSHNSSNYNNNNNTKLKTAVCLDTSLFGPNLNFFDVIEWVIYQRLLGFDHVFMTYIASSCLNKPGFDELQRLPYVTLQENKNSTGQNATYDDAILGFSRGAHILAGECDRLCVMETCLQTTAKQNYDWIFFAGVGQYLWFNQTMGINDFVARYGTDYDMLSFGRYLYSPKHQQRQPHDEDNHHILANDTIDPISGFWAENYPFTASTYCEKRTASGLLPDPCPMWPGRSKVMVRPAEYLGKFHKINIHGNTFEEKPVGHFQPIKGERAMHLPMTLAHLKQWSVNTRTIGPPTLVEKAETLVITPNDDQPCDGWVFYSDQGTKNVTLHYDAGLKDWFKYVASRGPYPDGCSQLVPSERPPK